MEYTELSNGVVLPRLMLGSFNVKSQTVMAKMVEAAVSVGLNGFDTSPSYGSEEILGEAIKNVGVGREKLFLSDKVDGWQMFTHQGEIGEYVDLSLKKLRTEYLDLLLIHWPFEKYIEKTWKCMERFYKSGKVRSLGLCNIDCRTYGYFLKNDIEIKPHVVQIEVSPFRTADADVELFQKERIIIEAYSPLCRMIGDIKENDILRGLAAKYNKTVSQIILRWHSDRSIIPIFTSSKPERVKENADIFDFYLTGGEIESINRLNRDYKIFPESFGCPGY